MDQGSRIKQLRTLAGMSQEELGRRIGVQRAAINKYEKGTVQNIPLTSLERISAIFDVSPTYIMGWDKSSSESLTEEIKVIQGIKSVFGKDAVELLETFTTLSKLGKRRLQAYGDELTKIYSE